MWLLEKGGSGMKDYQEALDTLECNAIQWASNHKYNEKHNFYIDSDMCDEMLNHSKLLQQLIDEKLEQESRKDKLIVGSKWECVAKNRGRNTIHKKGIEVYILKIEENFSIISYKTIYGWVEDVIPTDQFLLCFKPLKEGE